MALHIMVFNDTQEILELFREILTDEGYSVTLSSYGHNDLHKIEQVKPDMLILDLSPREEKPGWQLLQKLKMKRSTQAIPVVVCTTDIKFGLEVEGYLTSKGVGVVFKPFDIDDLLVAVKNTQGNSSATAGKAS
jgi:CheY-like chemotaxis protein